MIGLVETSSDTFKLPVRLCVRNGDWNRQMSSEPGDVTSPFQLRTKKVAVRDCRRKGS